MFVCAPWLRGRLHDNNFTAHLASCLLTSCAHCKWRSSCLKRMIFTVNNKVISMMSQFICAGTVLHQMIHCASDSLAQTWGLQKRSEGQATLTSYQSTILWHDSEQHRAKSSSELTYIQHNQHFEAGVDVVLPPNTVLQEVQEQSTDCGQNLPEITHHLRQERSVWRKFL